GQSETEGDLLLIASGAPLAELNIAFVTGRAAGLPKAVARAERYFAERGLPWRLEVDEALAKRVGPMAKSAGLTQLEERPGLLCRAPFEGITRPPRGTTVRRVRSPSEATIFAHVLATGSGFDPPSEMFDVPFHRLEDIRCYVGYVGDEPAACSMLHLSGGFAGIYAVATIESFRRQGLARAVTSESIREALDEGYRASCLQATEMGLPVYLGMGYEPVFGECTWTAAGAPTSPAVVRRSRRG
ncbi:MAG TPA: GNAT family N-acetyltransferase, partial [Thermoplasmata archaeon]